MKKKRNRSVVFALGMFNLVLAILTGALAFIPEKFPFISDITNFLSQFSLTAGAYSLLSIPALFLVLSIECFCFRKQSRASYIFIPYTVLLYISVLGALHKFFKISKPSFLMDKLSQTKTSLVFILVILELILALILVLIVQSINERYKRKQDFKARLDARNKQNAEDEEEVKAPVVDLPVEEVDKKKAKAEKKKEKKRKATFLEQKTEEARAEEEKSEEVETFSTLPAFNPDDKIEFPTFDEMPSLETLEVEREKIKNAEKLPTEVLMSSSTFKAVRDEVTMPEKEEEKKEEKIDVTKPQTFRRGGILEASLEAVTHKNEQVAIDKSKQKPIIGYDDRKEEVKVVKNGDDFAPSTLPKTHPRYKLFESLRRPPQTQVKDEPSQVSYIPAKPFEAEEEEEAPTPVVKVETPTPQSVQPTPSPAPVKPSQPEVAKPKYDPFTAVPSALEVEGEEEDLLAEEDDEKTSTPTLHQDVKNFEPVKPKQDVEPTASKELEKVYASAGVGGLQSNNEGLAALARRANVHYTPPSISFLQDYPSYSDKIDEATIQLGEIILQTMKDFHIEATSEDITIGPTVTMFEYRLAPGILVSKLNNIQSNLSMNLMGRSIRILTQIPGKQTVGVEVANSKRQVVGFKEMLPSIAGDKFKVPMILGKTITGEPVSLDVAKAPHLLIAGTTGSGKSVCVNSLICSILYTKSPKDVRLIMVDPKIVELSMYNGIGHLLTPVITEPKKVVKALEWLVDEMTRRYNIMRPYSVRNIVAYNEKIESGAFAAEKLPYIVLIMDEFADLMTTIGKEIEEKVGRLAAMSRAVGIHIVMATQRPSAEVVTGTLKSNIPARIAFAVSSGMNSRIILDSQGAENLLGKGDMLLLDPSKMGLQRIQGAFLSDTEVEKIVNYVRSQGEPDYLDPELFEDIEPDDVDEISEESLGNDEETLYEQAKSICYERKSASASYLQRRMKIGYNKAARFIERMEDEGIVGPAQGSKPREILQYK